MDFFIRLSDITFMRCDDPINVLVLDTRLALDVWSWCKVDAVLADMPLEVSLLVVLLVIFYAATEVEPESLPLKRDKLLQCKFIVKCIYSDTSLQKERLPRRQSIAIGCRCVIDRPGNSP